MRFRCQICGYVHEGDAPPDMCPVCGAGREDFVLMTEDAPAGVSAAVPAAAPASSAPMMPEPDADLRWVVLGGGIAGLSAVEAAREANPDAAITLVHREPSLPYNRLALTRYLAGEIPRDQLLIRSAGWFEQHRIRLVRAEARNLDRARQLVILDIGQEIPYDRLVIATGAHAFAPPIPGVRRSGVHVLRTLADADAILESARRGTRCVCIGGGLLGLEIAGGLAGRGLDVTVLDEAPWLLSRQLAQSASARLASHLGGLGIAIRTGVKPAEIAGDETVRAVLLADGTEVPADLVVLAAGVRPNVALARSAGLVVNRAIVVDRNLRASDPRVFAAGDVAEYDGVTWGLWTVALEQGRLAGRSLAGVEAATQGTPPTTQLKVLAWPVFSVGRFEPETPADRVLETADETRLVRVVLRDDIVIGANLVGDAALATALRRAVQDKLTLAAVPELGFLSQR
jgi:nitrite reductase (NADH) large subunit